MNYKIIGEEPETLRWQLLNREVKQKALSHMNEIKNNKNKESNFDKINSTNEHHSFEEECRDHCDWVEAEGGGDIKEEEEAKKFSEEIETRVQRLYGKHGTNKVRDWIFNYYVKRTLPGVVRGEKVE